MYIQQALALFTVANFLGTNEKERGNKVTQGLDLAFWGSRLMSTLFAISGSFFETLKQRL